MDPVAHELDPGPDWTNVNWVRLQRTWQQGAAWSSYRTVSGTSQGHEMIRTRLSAEEGASLDHSVSPSAPLARITQQWSYMMRETSEQFELGVESDKAVCADSSRETGTKDVADGLEKPESVHEVLVDLLLEADKVRLETSEPNLGVAKLQVLGRRLLDAESELAEVTTLVEGRLQRQTSRCWGDEGEDLLTRLSRVREVLTGSVVMTAQRMASLDRFERAGAVWRAGESGSVETMLESGFEADDLKEGLDVVEEEETQMSEVWQEVSVH